MDYHLIGAREDCCDITQVQQQIMYLNIMGTNSQRVLKTLSPTDQF